MTEYVEIRHFHLFCGLGGGAAGFNRGHARVGRMQARFRCIGGIDSDPAAIRDFGRLAGVPGTVMDLFDREQYTVWHGHEPPADWREATPADLQRAAGNERPHIIFTSPPCKGFSGLLSQSRSTTEKYQALNRLTLRGIWLSLEAWKDDPPELFILENVPRIMDRGRYLLDQIISLLEHYGYAVRESTHNCGELGGLAQSRRRFLLVARHQVKMPAFLYEPPLRSLRAVGDVLGDLPLPGDLAAGGPMHRIPSLQWKTWVRLAFVRAGSDWRSLNDYAVEDGYLRDYLLVPEMHRGVLGVRDWNQPGATVIGASRSYNGAYNVADPRFSGEAFAQFGVRRWDWNMYRVVRWDRSAGTVIGAQQVGSGAQSVADPRLPAPDEKLQALIIAEDDTWHRPFTTLELAALQGLVTPDSIITLDGGKDSAWRERVGNAVPPPAAEAIASVMGEALLLARTGETFRLSATPVWVRPLAVSLAMPGRCES